MKSCFRPRYLLSLILAGMLQMMPFLRIVLPMEARGMAPSAWAWILKLGAGAAALLGSYDSVSGATQIVQPYSVNATVGTAYSRQLTTSGQTAHSWSANTAPLRTAVYPLTPGLWLTNSNGRIGGVPTWAGTSNITINAWENSGNSGATVSAVFVFTITGGGTSPPTITTQPRSLTNNVGTSATFTVGASGTGPLTYQWRFQGNPISGATASAYTLPSVQTTDAGTYTVVVSNAGGSVTSAAAVLTVVQNSADLATGIAGTTTVAAGGNFSISVGVTNLGPSAAANVVLSDRLPPGAGFVSATGGGVANGGVVTWPAIASLALGASASYGITLTAPGAGPLTNIVSANSGTTDPNAVNNNGSSPAARLVTAVTPQADLSVTAAGPASASAAALITYTIGVNNTGPSDAANVAVVDTLPAGATFVSASVGGALNGNSVAWPILPTLAAGRSTNLTLTVRAPAEGAITNRAAATSSTFDPVASNNDGSSPAATVVTAIQPQADVAVWAQGAPVISAGSNLVYTVVVSNIGPSTASNVVVGDILPGNGTFVSASGGGSLNAGTVTWPSITSLANGASSSFTITVTAPSSGSLTNRAYGNSATADPAPGNNDGSSAAAQVITAVVPVTGQQADLAVLGSGPSSALAGSVFTCTVTVTNLGSSPASNVVVSALLPSGAAFVSATGSGVPSGQNVTWPAVPSFASGATLSYNVSLTAPGEGALTTTFSAISSTPDPNAQNNNGTAAQSRVITSVTPQADVTAAGIGPALVDAGANYSYVIAVTNLGPSTASNVVVRDILPAGVTFVSATGSGAVNAGTVTWPAVTALSSGGILNYSVTVKAPATGQLTNTVSSTAGTSDPDVANNDGTAAAAVVVTSVHPLADLVVGASGPALVYAGSNLTYTITVTNLGPSAASNVVVTDLTPANAVLANAPGGNVVSNRVTWSIANPLGSGTGAAFSVTVRAPTTGTLLNVASAGASTADPNPANNDGSAAGSQVQTSIASANGQFGITSSGHAINPQTGLVEEMVAITNTGPATVAAMRLYVTGLRSGVWLANASGTNAGRAYVQFNASLNPGQGTVLRLEFFVGDRQPFSDSLSAEAVLPDATVTVPGAGVAISRSFVDNRIAGSPRFVIEFPSVPGQVYTIIYSDDATATWKVATPSITASSTSTQWYDDGPPKTAAAPLQGGSRFYRVIADAANP